MRLIDADALERMGYVLTRTYQQDKETMVYETKNLSDVPSAQPERKTGKWQITHAYPHNVHCSVCHKRFAQTHWAVWEDGTLPRNFCPNCGADMRGENDETD